MNELLDLFLDPRLAAVAVAVFVGGFLRGFVGFGAALVSVPIMSMVFGPKLAVAISSVMGFPALVQLLPEAVRHAERHIVLPIAGAIFLAAPIGSTILMFTDPAIMRIVISALVVLMVAMLAQGWTFKGEAKMGTLLAAGIAGGLIQGSAGVGGPPVVAVALSRPAVPKLQRANVLALMTAVALSSILPLLYFGLFTQKSVVVGLAMLPIFSGATALGSRYFSRGGDRYFRSAALAMLGAVGVGSLASAIASYITGV